MKPLSRTRALLIFAALWAAIYLPGLGSAEFKGEEGRRVQPAVTMLETGEWLVPYLGGKPYLRKPPLVNWLIAGSFKATGRRDEWAARLPSVLMVLIMGATFIALSSGRGGWDPAGGLMAAIFCATPLGLLAKARFAGAEIEGIYVPLGAMAVALWMAGYAQRRSPWWLWTVPFVFLGMAALAKGPSFHLIAFYMVVAATLASQRDWRGFFHPAHLGGIIIAAAIFCAWAVPFSRSPQAAEAAAVWKRQGLDRFNESEFGAGEYFLNIPRAIGDQLPWALLLPAALGWGRKRREGTPPDSSETTENLGLVPTETFSRPKFVSLILVAGSFTLLLVPGMLPRYVLPFWPAVALIIAVQLQKTRGEDPFLMWWNRGNTCFAALLLAVLVSAPMAAGVPVSAHSIADGVRLFRFQEALRAASLLVLPMTACVVVLVRRPVLLSAWTLAVRGAVLMGVAGIVYAVAVVPWLAKGERARPLASRIDALVPRGARFVICDPDYLPALFYLKSPFSYAPGWKQVPRDAEFVLVRPKALEKKGVGFVGWDPLLWENEAQGGGVVLLRRSEKGAGQEGSGL
jgi:4-amino-4-deoxy-L-arabinose transferase-like glycosyltransferase